MAALPHLTVACILKKYTNTSISLFGLIASAYLSDILAFFLSVFRLDSILYQNTLLDGSFWNHGLFMVMLISILLSVIYFIISKKKDDSLIVFLTILSHWLIDFITWPLGCIWTNAPGLMVYWNNNIRVGFGLYNNKTAMIITEALSLVMSLLFIISMSKKRKQYRLKKAKQVTF